MDTQKWIKGIRLILALLLVPAIVPFWLVLSLYLEIQIFPERGANGAGLALFANVLLHFGTWLAYLGALAFGLPCLLFMAYKQRLNFVNVMVATELFALIYYVALVTIVGRIYPVLPNLAVYSVPAVVISGLCFYLVGVWNPWRRKSAW